MTRNTPNLRDENQRVVGSGVSSVDSVTPIMLRVDPITDFLLVDDTVGAQVATSRQWNKRDENGYPTMYGISSTDSITLVPIRTDSSGRLLVKYT